MLFVAWITELLIFVVYTAARASPGRGVMLLILAGILAMLVAMGYLVRLARKGVRFSVRDAWRRR